MKPLLLTTIAAVLLVGCGKTQQSAPQAEAKPVEPVAEVAEVAQPEQPTAKAPDISIHDAVEDELPKHHPLKHIVLQMNVVALDGITGLY